MTIPAKINGSRAKPVARLEKRARRKEELASFAIDTLKRLGYARSSLRDIAKASDVSVGVLHYYFEDKVDLISYCVQKYKKEFIARMDAIVASASDAESVIAGLASGLGDSIEFDGQTHRLWYDIRTQALFDDVFQDMVSEIEAALMDFVARMMARVGLPSGHAVAMYTALDGAFRFHLQRHLAGDSDAAGNCKLMIEQQLRAAVAAEVAPRVAGKGTEDTASNALPR